MQVTIWYADDLRLVGHFSDQDDPALTWSYVWSGDIEAAGDDYAVLAEVWGQFNRGSGVTHPDLDREELRSLSVGDIVKLGGAGSPRFYRCSSLDWKPTEPTFARGGESL